jgi:DNA-binding NarL/FixJ family response regulator
MVLVDLNMNDEDVTALLTELRQMRIPILVCSMNETPSQVKRAMAAGAEDTSPRAKRGRSREPSAASSKDGC